MAAPKVNEAVTLEAVKTVPAAEAKTSEPMVIESVAQYIDEFDPATAMRMMQQHLAMSDELRRLGAGRWEVPGKYRHMVAPGPNGRPAYRFIRLGTMSDPKRRDAILRQRAICELMGWKLAPSGTRNALYLTDGDQGVYMCLPEAAGQAHDEHERKTRMEIRQRRFSKSIKALPEDMAKLGSKHVSIESLDVSRGSMSVGDFNKSR